VLTSLISIALKKTLPLHLGVGNEHKEGFPARFTPSGAGMTEKGDVSEFCHSGSPESFFYL